MVLLCDGYLKLLGDDSSPAHRFFKMAARLPMELQMVVCNRAYGSPKDSINSTQFNQGLKSVLKMIGHYQDED